MRGSYRFVFLLLLLAATLPLLATAEEQLAALYVDGEEVDAVIMYMEDKQIYLPKEMLESIPKLDVNKTADTITTPIGTVAYSTLFPEGHERDYFPLSNLDKVLRIRGKYFPKEVALGLWTPWYYLRNRKTQRHKDADVLPASNLFNGIRLDVATEYLNNTFNTRTELGLTGRVLDGITRISALQNRDQTPYINELFWLKDENRYRILAGIQNTQPHVLLPYVEMTGMQAMWSNYDLPDISDLIEPTLRPSFGPDNRIITGKGPIGGSVVLRINDKAVLAERIRLDGTYRMNISQQNISAASLVELWVYERDPVGAPIKKINLNYLSSATLLEKGQFNILGGVGEGDNLFNPVYDNNNTLVGDLYMRYGLTHTITLEGGAMQDAQNRKYALFAATATVGDNLTLHAALSTQEGLLASYVTVDGHWEDDYLIARGRREPKGYRGIEADTEEIYLDYVKQLNDTLSIGVNGRYYQDVNDDIAFLLPTVRYQPLSTLLMSLIPNYEGDYRFSATYTPNVDLRFNYIYEAEEHRLSVVDYLTDEWSLYFDGVNNFQEKERYEAGVNWRSLERNDIYFEAAGIYSKGNFGYKASLRHNLFPGVYAKYEARYEPYNGNEKQTAYYFVNLIADFAFIEGSFHPKKAPETKKDLKGYIVGNVYINHTAKHIDSKDINILINGSPIKAGESSGRFLIDELKEGTYLVELDPSLLPMEYTPVKSSYYVKVSNGAVSKVNFYVDVFYGIAGKLHRKTIQEPVKVVLTSVANGKEYTTYTDQFDYYRFDAIPSGTYKLYISDETLHVSPRTVTVKNDFLFDQDLYISR